VGFSSSQHSVKPSTEAVPMLTLSLSGTILAPWRRDNKAIMGSLFL
jgi:hypothetical protein